MSRSRHALLGALLILAVAQVAVVVPSEAFVRAHRDDVVHANVLGGEASVLPAAMSALTGLH